MDLTSRFTGEDGNRRTLALLLAEAMLSQAQDGEMVSSFDLELLCIVLRSLLPPDVP